MLSHRLIWHGRRVCHARQPACGACGWPRALPVLRDRPHGRGDGRQAGQGRARLLPLSGRRTRCRGAPGTGRRCSDASRPPGPLGRRAGWLRDLAAAGRGHASTRAPLRPPPGRGAPPRSWCCSVWGRTAPTCCCAAGPGLRRHPGQPAFPGGAIDEADAGPVPAALREAAEEAGVEASGVEVLAVLPDLFIARSGFAVTPVLAWWRRPVPVAAADPREVTAVARVPLSELSDPGDG